MFLASLRPQDQMLFRAIESGDETLLGQSLALGANVSLQDAAGRSPLFILAQSALPQASALLRTVALAGADWESIGSQGQSPLGIACMRRLLSNARALLELGADANFKDGEGWTPLHSAAWACELDLIRALLEAGANPAIPNQFGQLPHQLDPSGRVFALLRSWSSRLEARSIEAVLARAPKDLCGEDLLWL